MSNSITNKAAVLDQFGNVFASVDVAANVREIEYAGARAANGAPVNRVTRKVSRSKRNLSKARYMHASMIEFKHNGETYYLLAE